MRSVGIYPLRRQRYCFVCVLSEVTSPSSIVFARGIHETGPLNFSFPLSSVLTRNQQDKSRMTSQPTCDTHRNIKREAALALALALACRDRRRQWLKIGPVRRLVWLLHVRDVDHCESDRDPRAYLVGQQYPLVSVPQHTHPA